MIYRQLKRQIKQLIRQIKQLQIRIHASQSSRRALHGRLALTYANDSMTDGAGAQLHRIYGIYALSRLFNLPYVHSPLKAIGYQGLVALENDANNPDLVAEYNRQFTIPSDITLSDDFTRHDIEHITLDNLLSCQDATTQNTPPTLLRITFPYKLTDLYPKAYTVVQALSPYTHVQQDKVIRIAVHVRRGELYAVDSHRMLANDYYITTALGISKILDALNMDYVFELHTEVATKAFTVTGKSHGIFGRIENPVRLDPGDNKLEEFAAIPRLIKHINDSALKTLEQMATAHVLIMSHSSFSYLPALFNRLGIIIYHPFGHPPLNHWLVCNDHGQFSEKLFRQRLALRSAYTV